MQADLHHPVSSLCHIGHHAALHDRMSGWLFEKYVGACLECSNCWKGMPMIRRCNDDDLRFLLGKHLPVVLVLARLVSVKVSDFLRGDLHRMFMHIT